LQSLNRQFGFVRLPKKLLFISLKPVCDDGHVRQRRLDAAVAGL
jgi:hypothetical protein